jgi:hypothetical protein
VGPAGHVIEKLEELIQVTHGKGLEEVNPLSQGEISNLSTSSSSQACPDPPPSRKIPRNKKLPPRPPSLQAGGPKCIRFMEAVNNVGAVLKKRGTPPEMNVAARSTEFLTHSADAEAVLDCAVETIDGGAQPAIISGQSRVNYIMDEEDLEDVDGFLRKREAP